MIRKQLVSKYIKRSDVSEKERKKLKKEELCYTKKGNVFMTINIATIP